MKVDLYYLVAALLVGFIVGAFLSKRRMMAEGFATSATCTNCSKQAPCGCPEPRLVCPPCREPDLSKYVLKASIPPPPSCPDMSRYMLKTECPPVPDLSQYVLKSSIPKQQPIIIDTSVDSKAKCGECPPCPRPRCSWPLPRWRTLRWPWARRCRPSRPHPRPRRPRSLPWWRAVWGPRAWGRCCACRPRPRPRACCGCVLRV